MSKGPIALLVVLLVLLVGPALVGHGGAAGRLVVVISDLHLGVGRVAGRWHPYEDFRWSKELQSFLDYVDARGRGQTDLVLNGDTFELWQSLTNDCVYDDTPEVGCSENEAVDRLKHVLGQHVDELGALGQFARKADNRLIIVPGNHDAVLLTDAARGAVATALGNPPPTKLEIPASGEWLSEDRWVYASHGHQIGRDVNSWREEWPTPFRQGPKGRHLARTWGERFVQKIYNDYECTYPIVDNISSEMTGVRYIVAAGNAVRAVKGFAEFLSFFFTDVSGGQFVNSILGDQTDKPPDWDVASIEQYSDAEWRGFLAGHFEPDDPMRNEVLAALDQGQLASLRSGLSDNDLRALCDERAKAFGGQLRTSALSDPGIKLCPLKGGGTLGTAEGLRFKVSTAARMATYEKHIDGTLQRLVKAGKTNRAFAVFVTSHTHLAERLNPFPRNAAWSPTVLNTGAWQRTVTPARLERIRIAKGSASRAPIPTSETLRKVTLDDLDACYPAVWVENQRAELLYWNVSDSGKGSLGRSCRIRPEAAAGPHIEEAPRGCPR